MMHLTRMKPIGHPAWRDERGAALITVLFVFMIAALIAMGMLTRTRLVTLRTGNMLSQNQAYAEALGAELWARQLLLVSAKREPGLDHLGQPWANANAAALVTNGALTLRIEDEQARFNLNGMIDSDLERGRFLQLVRLLGLREEVAPIIIARLGTKAAPQLLHDESELRAIEGLLPDEVTRLMPHVVALPETESTLNVNTASDMLLRAYIPDAEAYARFITALRKTNYLTRAELNAIGVITKGMDVTSAHFQVTVMVPTAHGRLILRTELAREEDNFGNPLLRIIRRDLSGE